MTRQRLYFKEPYFKKWKIKRVPFSKKSVYLCLTCKDIYIKRYLLDRLRIAFLAREADKLAYLFE